MSGFVDKYPPVDFDVFSWLHNFQLHAAEIQSFEGDYDLLIVLTSDSDIDEKSPHFKIYDECFNTLKQYKSADKAFDSEMTFIVLKSEKNLPHKLLHCPIGHLNKDYDDVRQIGDAAYKAVQRALKIGAQRWLLVIPSSKMLKSNPNYVHSDLVTLLHAYASTYVPLELREVKKRQLAPLRLDIASFNGSLDKSTLLIAKAIECGRIVCRDIGGSDPERMAPPMVASYVKQIFQKSSVTVDILEDESEIERQYPLMAAVNRAARGIPRHRARAIFLTYEPQGPHETTVILVGKGITFDTGGANIKIHDNMTGMHRDKCGAAFVAGFFMALELLKPKNIKVIGAMCMARNSVGPDSYVADEIITNRFGRRIRIDNTDAEGRMVMADVLCHMKEKALNEPNPHLYTIATLTGHACLAVGQGYSIVLPNGPAFKAGLGTSLFEAGHVMGDPFEISTLRREDYAKCKGRSIYEDLRQSNNVPSCQTPRGHQLPMAFLISASGLDEHGNDSNKPLKYCHIDIAASEGEFPGIPTGSPIPTFVKHYIMPNL